MLIPGAVRAALAQIELGRDQAVRGERTAAATEFTQATLAVREVGRLDARAAAAQLGSGAGAGVNGDRSADSSRVDEAARLELQAREYKLLATQSGVPEQSPAQLMELASDARSQAQLHRDVDQGRESAPAVSVGADQGRASVERREGPGAVRQRRTPRGNGEGAGIARHPQESIDGRMRAYIAQGRPASEAAAHTTRVKRPQDERGRGATRSVGRADRSR